VSEALPEKSFHSGQASYCWERGRPRPQQRAQHAKKSKKSVTIVRASRSIAGEDARVPKHLLVRQAERRFFGRGLCSINFNL
jgi:hypothetical protein